MKKELISNRCISGLMSNLIKKSWTDSIEYDHNWVESEAILIFVSHFVGPTSPTRCPCFPKEKSFVADSKFSAYNFCDKSCSSWSLKNCDKNHFDGKKQNLILVLGTIQILRKHVLGLFSPHPPTL